MKTVLIFGSTGSIGRNALRVIKKQKGKFKVLGLCANRNVALLARQAREFKPRYVCLRGLKQAEKLKSKLGSKVIFFSGEAGLDKFSSLKSDISLMAISGIAALKPLFKNLKHTKRLALANKESLVCAGNLVFKEASKHKTEVLPVDSEISALFQLFDSRPGQPAPRRAYITASGGALAGCKKKDLARVSPKKVLSHPTWNMGSRITVDCATLVNKAFEVIETKIFFSLPYERIEVLIHRESKVHALLEYSDNTVLGCSYPPNMRIPISYAFSYPRRLELKEKPGLFSQKLSYSFARLKKGDYPLFDLVLEAAGRKDNSLIILNACDEVAVEYFLAGKIKFTDIHRAMKHIFSNYPAKRIKKINDVFFWDDWAREKTRELLRRL